MSKLDNVISELLYNIELSFSKDIVWKINSSSKSCVVKLNLPKSHYVIFVCTIEGTNRGITDISYSASVFKSNESTEKEFLVREIQKRFFYHPNISNQFQEEILSFIKKIASECS